MSSRAYVEETNSIRFENLSQRLQKVNVDVVHRVHATGSLDTGLSAAPSTGSLGCHFQDELEQRKDLDTASQFKRFYYEVWPLVQSLPELLHHKDKVVALLEDRISTVPPIILPSFLQLVSVLGRDLGDDLFSHFHQLFNCLLKRLDHVVFSGSMNATGKTPNPELTGQLFECFSYLIKYLLGKLVDEPDCMRQYYGAILGHGTSFVRDLAAKSLTVLFRKLKTKIFKSHMKKVFKALAVNCINICKSSLTSDGALEDLFQVIEIEASKEHLDIWRGAVPRKVRDILDGFEHLLFYTLKGVKGCLHSQAQQRLQILFDFLLPLDVASTQSITNFKSSSGTTSSNSTSTSKKTKQNKQVNSLPTQAHLIKSKDLPDDVKDSLQSVTLDRRFHIFVCGNLLSSTFQKLCRHDHPSNIDALLSPLFACIEICSKSWAAVFMLEDPTASLVECLTNASLYLTEMLIFALSHSNGRALSDAKVRETLKPRVLQVTMEFCTTFLGKYSQPLAQQHLAILDKLHNFAPLCEKMRTLLCRLWLLFPTDSKLNKQFSNVLPDILGASVPTPAILVMSKELLGKLSSSVIRKYLARPMLIVVASFSLQSVPIEWLSVLLEVLTRLRDVRPNAKRVHVVTSELKDKKKKRNADEDSEEDWEGGDDDSEDDDAGSSHSDDDDSMEESDDDHAVSRPNKSGDGSKSQLDELRDSSKELASLVESCVDLLSNLLVSSSSTVSSSSSKSALSMNSDDKKVCILSCMCLQWVIKVLPDILTETKSIATKLSKLKKTLIALFGNKESLLKQCHDLGCKVTSSLGNFLILMVDDKDASVVNSMIKNYVHLVVSNPRSLSLWSTFVDLLKLLPAPASSKSPNSSALKSLLTDSECDSLLESIGSTLSTPSHWLRLNLLQVLAFLPNPTYTMPTKSSSSSGHQDAIHEIEVAALCLEAESMKIQLEKERKFAFILGKFEVYAREGRIPPLT